MTEISIHALLAESDAVSVAVQSPALQFLSTLSLRRATVAPVLAVGRAGYFYPRSPCGERPVTRVARTPTTVISIHALLAESDMSCAWSASKLGDFYPRSPCGERLLHTNKKYTKSEFLSTLSLRRATTEEVSGDTWQRDFYPRSPCGERHEYCSVAWLDYSISIHALLAESDLLTMCILCSKI